MSALITKLKNKINHQRKIAIRNQTNKQTNKHLNKSLNKKHQKSGHLMLMVLLLLVILTMFVTSLYALSLMNVKESIIYHEKNQAYLVAKSGAETVIDQLALLSNNELNHRFEENNPQTIEGDIAGGHYTATIMKYGKQIMIDVQSTYKRTTSSSLTQMVDVNRYGIVYVENGNIDIISSDNNEIKLTADIAQYNNAYRGLKISGKGEIDGNIYTRSKVDVDSLRGKLELGSIYTDQQVDMDVSQNCKIYFNGLYTSYPISKDIFQKDTDFSTNGAEIIGNELQRGDNNIGDHPNFLKIRTARNIISLRYTDKFGYTEFPGPKKNEAVFVTQAFEIPYENIKLNKSNDWSINNNSRNRIKTTKKIELKEGQNKEIGLQELKNIGKLEVTGNGILKIQDNIPENENLKTVNLEISDNVILDLRNIDKEMKNINLKGNSLARLPNAANFLENVTLNDNSSIELNGFLEINENLIMNEKTKIIYDKEAEKTDLIVLGSMNIENESEIYLNGSINVQHDLENKGIIKNKGEVIVSGNIELNGGQIIYNGNDETNIIVANQIDIDNGTIKFNGIKAIKDFEVKGTSDIDLGQNLVSQNLNIGENSHVSGKGLYINELKTQGKIKFEEIRNINISSRSIDGGQVEISGKGYVETNDIIANNLIIKDTAYVKAMAISVENDFKLQNGSELDMTIYEDLTDINSKNSYSNIIWMDKN